MWQEHFSDEPSREQIPSCKDALANHRVHQHVRNKGPCNEWGVSLGVTLVRRIATCDEPVEETGGTHVGTGANCAEGVSAEVFAYAPGRICEHKVVDVSVRNLEGSVLYMSYR